MSTRLMLEDFTADVSLSEFGQQAPASSKAMSMSAEIERARAEGYETGYSAGWDDANAAHMKDKDNIDAAFAQNLEDLGFTFQEARSHVLSSLAPLLDSIFNVFLPKIAHQALGPIVEEQLMGFASEAADTPIEILVGPGSRHAVEGLLDRDLSVPISIVEEESMPDGQVYLRSSHAEQCIDLEVALQRTQDALMALYETKEKAFSHG